VAPVSATAALAAVLGATTGIGLLLVTTGWHGAEPHGRRRWWARHGHREPRNPRPVLRPAGVLGAGLLAGLVTGWPIGAILAGTACWALPALLRRDPEHAHRIGRVEGIATWTEMLRDTLSAAAGLEQAILTTAPLAPASIHPEVAALATRLNNGDRLAPSLRTLADQLADPTADLVIAALLLAAEQHARHLGDLLGALAHAARDQASMRLRVDAGRARIRTSVRVIVGTTLTFAVAVVLLDRPYLTAYDTATGQLVLLGIGALFTTGFAWLMRIARPDEPARFLTLTRNPTPVPEGQV
jgi:Flp pilus assembly protein TadB